MLTEMNGDPWNPTPQPRDKPPQALGVYITLERQFKCGGAKGLCGIFGQSKVHSLECRARFQEIADNEAAQAAAASASEPSVETPGQAAGGPAPSPNSGHSGGFCGVDQRPEDVNMGASESSAAQPTSSVVRTLENEDDASAKRQRLIAGMPILHEIDVEINVGAHKMVVLAAMPDDQEQWTQRVIDWDKKYYGAKSGTLLDTQKVCEGRLRERVQTLRSWKWRNPFSCRMPEHRVWRSFTENGWMMREGRRRTRMRSGTDWLRHR